MGVAVIQGFLTHPGTGADSDSQHRISATAIALTGDLFTMPNDIHEKAKQEYNIDTAFSHVQNGINWTRCQEWLDVIAGFMREGITRSPSPRRVERLAKWLEEDLVPRFRGRLLSVDAEVMRTWGRITGRALLQGRPVSYVDSLLVATAIAHGLSLATRNVGDVAMLPVQTTNPWDGPETSAPVKGN